MAELCRQFGISRNTGYQLLGAMRPKANMGCEIARTPRMVIPTRSPRSGTYAGLGAYHPTWGTAQAAAWLQMDDPAARWPAANTIGDIPHRHGLVIPLRRVPAELCELRVAER
jgi:hypothetical protein